MPVSTEFRAWVMEQLEGFGPVSGRAMFGGVGLYARGLFFGLLDDDVVFLRVDADSRVDFEAAGSRPFAPVPGGPPMLGYWELPAEALEDRRELHRWCERACTAAIAARAKTAGRKQPRTPTGGARSKEPGARSVRPRASAKKATENATKKPAKTQPGAAVVGKRGGRKKPSLS